MVQRNFFLRSSGLLVVLPSNAELVAKICGGQEAAGNSCLTGKQRSSATYNADGTGELKNLTEDPYYTDGLRAVMIFLKEPLPKKQVRYMDWDEAEGEPD